jgi:hypothetical protein
MFREETAICSEGQKKLFFECNAELLNNEAGKHQFHLPNKE